MKKLQPFGNVKEYVDSLETETIMNPDSSRYSSGSYIRPEDFWHFGAHSHDDLELLYFIDGSAEVMANNTSFYAGTSTLLAYPPGLVHREFPELRKSMDMICVIFKIESSCQLKVPFHIVDKQGDLLWLFTRFYEEYERNHSGCANNGSYLETLYLKMIVEHIKKYFAAYSPKTNEIVNYCIEYIEAHFPEELNLGKLSDLVYCSPSYISRLFREHTGKAPMQYLNQVRIEASKSLLRSTTNPMKRISESVGICDPLYFSRLFKKTTSQTPSDYRAKSGEP